MPILAPLIFAISALLSLGLQAASDPTADAINRAIQSQKSDSSEMIKKMMDQKIDNSQVISAFEIIACGDPNSTQEGGSGFIGSCYPAAKTICSAVYTNAINACLGPYQTQLSVGISIQELSNGLFSSNPGSQWMKDLNRCAAEHTMTALEQNNQNNDPRSRSCVTKALQEMESSSAKT